MNHKSEEMRLTADEIGYLTVVSEDVEEGQWCPRPYEGYDHHDKDIGDFAFPSDRVQTLTIGQAPGELLVLDHHISLYFAHNGTVAEGDNEHGHDELDAHDGCSVNSLVLRFPRLVAEATAKEDLKMNGGVFFVFSH